VNPLEISDRKKKILAAIINEYIQTAEPVGSKAIADMAGLGLSSATIRNEMAELTSMGFLEQPHTSAGRIPSPLGYRMYVNELMQQHKLSIEETEAINRRLNTRIQQLDKLISDVGRLASQLTSYPALALAAPARATISRFDFIYIDTNTFIIVVMLSNNTVKNKLVHLPFSVEQHMMQKLTALFNASFTGITEDKITEFLINSTERASGDTYGLVAVIAGFAIEVLYEAGSGEAYISGTSTLLCQPEFRDPAKAQRVMNYLSDRDHLLELPELALSGDIKVLIGPENIAEELKDSSIVMASYSAGDSLQGIIGIVGPTRMDYPKIAAKLSYIASCLNRILGGPSAPPGLDNKLIKGDDINEQEKGPDR
jgi:heat-inducible transcriptional repressor